MTYIEQRERRRGRTRGDRDDGRRRRRICAACRSLDQIRATQSTTSDAPQAAIALESPAAAVREPVSVDPDAIAATGPVVRVSERRWADLIAFCDLREDDVALLGEVASSPDVRRTIAESFYDHVLAQPDLRAIIDSQLVDRRS